MSGALRRGQQPPFRTKGIPHRKWQHNEEVALIDFIKQNRDFEKPCGRVYYTKFLFETGIDVDWKLVRSKVRNMRTSYRKAKELELNKQEFSNCNNVELLKNQIYKICWYVDDFDILFPNEADNYAKLYSDPIFDDELSKDESSCNADNLSKNFKNNPLLEEDSTVSSLSKSIDGDIKTDQTNLSDIKKEKRVEDTNIKQESELAKEILNRKKQKLRRDIRLKEIESRFQQTPFRNRCHPVRKWQRNEEVAIIVYLKEYRDFERPTARIYYTKFLVESGIDMDWQRVRSKVRNMRTTYRRAKEHEINNAESNDCNVRALRNQILKICWYVDDFDIIFPNEMDNFIYKQPNPTFEDEFSRDESICNVDNSSKNVENNFLLDEDSTSSSSKSIDEDITAVRTNLFNLKSQKRNEDTSIKQQELELAKEKLNFEKEKLRQETKLKEKEIEVEERLKVMEFQMKERIAIKELEIEERLALRSIRKPENSYSNVYHNLT